MSRIDRKDNPCFKCEERSVECHGKCEKYKAYRDRVYKEKKAMIAHNIENDIYRYFGN